MRACVFASLIVKYSDAFQVLIHPLSLSYASTHTHTHSHTHTHTSHWDVESRRVVMDSCAVVFIVDLFLSFSFFLKKLKQYLPFLNCNQVQD